MSPRWSVTEAVSSLLGSVAETLVAASAQVGDCSPLSPTFSFLF